ncbi:hypothetical protein F7D34_13845 [Prevotella copri]|uniref:Uncharacterized protein n=2 Tax=Segatella copri TaxID=165179 RepID=A0A646HLV2_9BACT|nr:hypothetical protein [Segatella copri]MQO79010.1 hypothetical protein [Segatella copri]
MGMYDVEYGKRGNMSDFSYTLGTEYGYVFPLSSRFCLHLFPVWQLASAIQMEQKQQKRS